MSKNVLMIADERDVEREALDGMTCQQAFAKVGEGNAECARISVALTRHPFLSRVFFQPTILHAYERANGPIVGAVPWLAIVQWLITNAPTVIQLLLSLLSLFGL